MRDHCNYHELSVTRAMLVLTAVSYLLVVTHCILNCVLSGHKNNWQGCFEFVFLCGRRKEEFIMVLIRGPDCIHCSGTHSLCWFSLALSFLCFKAQYRSL